MKKGNMQNSISKIASSRILILDGAMGTMIQQYKLKEEDFRGERFAFYHLPLKGNYNLLTLTQAQIITEIHEKYLAAGADIIKTNSFNAQSISLADYEMEILSYEINLESARIAKSSTKKFSTAEKPRFVAGSIGPTNKFLSSLSQMEQITEKTTDFVQMSVAFETQIEGLIDGGADILLVETIIDVLNVKACLLAIKKVFERKKAELPVMISISISDNSGRLHSGETIKAFIDSIFGFPYFSLGINCSLGAKSTKPYLYEISKLSNSYVSVHPSAGLPNKNGIYSETPEEMAEIIKFFVDENLVNIIGGCCGTTPEHIKLFNNIAKLSNSKFL